MKLLRLAVPLILLIMSAVSHMAAQTAKVVELTSEEAAKAKQLHEAVVAAQKSYDDFHVKIAKKYLSLKGGRDETHGEIAWGDIVVRSTKEGWDYGFEFSEDYQFIVPKPYQATAPTSCSGYIWSNATTPTFCPSNSTCYNPN